MFSKCGLSWTLTSTVVEWAHCHELAPGCHVLICLPQIHFEPAASLTTRPIHHDHRWWLLLERGYGRRSGQGVGQAPCHTLALVISQWCWSLLFWGPVWFFSVGIIYLVSLQRVLVCSFFMLPFTKCWCLILWWFLLKLLFTTGFVDGSKLWCWTSLR